jgi:hypothetical protein
MDFGLGASEQSVSAVVKADFFSIQFLQTGFRHAQHQQITALAHQHISKSTHHQITKSTHHRISITPFRFYFAEIAK